MVENMLTTLEMNQQSLLEAFFGVCHLPVAAKALRIPSVLFPPSGINCSYAILDAVDAELIQAHPNNGAMLEMCGVGDCIVTFTVALVCYPQVSEERNRPVG